MGILMMVAQLIVALAILVTLHELGHFMAARAFGIKVEKFYLFFDAWGFKFFSFKKGDTEYGLGWLPLGGYVKISGMIDESMDTEQLKKDPEPWEFRSKPAWQRLIVMVGGVTMNILLGIGIYTYILLQYQEKYLPAQNINDGIYAYELGREIGLQTGDKITAINGKLFDRFEDLLGSRVVFGSVLTVDRKGEKVDVVVPDDFYKKVSKSGSGNFISPYQATLEIDSVFPNNPAAQAGLQKGDKLVALNGERYFGTERFKKELSENKSKPVDIKILRNNDTLAFTPVVSDSGLLGIAFRPYMGNYAMVPYTLGKALSNGTSDAFEAITSTVKGFRQIFAGKEKASESLQGPIGIARIYGPVWDWPKFWAITGLLSMVLAFMNLLPIPALDGGHVLFLLIEMVSRRKLSDKFLERAQLVGMVILLTLMVFVFGNDILKAVKG